MKLCLMFCFLLVGCSSNKSAKQEFNDTADQVDRGVRNVIEEVKDTSSKVLKKIQD